jgi:hypothetical protein
MISDEHYHAEAVTINLIWANIFGIIVMVIAAAIFGLPFYALWAESIQSNAAENSALSTMKTMMVCFVLLFFGIILHELIHGAFFALFAKGRFKSVQFGILPSAKLFTPYCHCKEKLRINHYRMAILMPLLIMGIIPAIISLITGNIYLLLWSIVFITAACGDILIFLKTLKEKRDTWIFDHPTEAGYFLYRHDAIKDTAT